MTEQRAPVTPNWPEFYDPDSYERSIGPGARVSEAYRALLSGGAPKVAVEYGCGPGQIAIALARDGHSVIGVDRAPDMISRARLRVSEEPESVSRLITLMHSSLENATLPRRVDAVLLTNELVLHILEAESLVKTFSRSFGQLDAGGRILLDLPNVDLQVLAHAAGPNKDLEFCRGLFPTSNGETLRVCERVTFDTGSWAKEMIFRYELIGADGCVRAVFFRRLKQRIWTLEEIRFGLLAAGALRIEVSTIAPFNDRVFVAAEARS